MIVPTLGETDNLVSKLPRFADEIADSGLTAELILVTDDTTRELKLACDVLNSSLSVQLIYPEHSQSPTTAFMDGLQAASGEFLLVLTDESCLSRKLIQALSTPLLEQQADFVMGSPEIKSGSPLANWLVRPLTKEKDPWADCFALSRDKLEQCEEHLTPSSPHPALELIVKGEFEEVVTVPLNDHSARKPASTVGEWFRLGAQLKTLYEFKFKNYAYFLQFAIVGSSGVIVNLLALSLLLDLMIRPLAVATAIWIAMTSNFLLNRHITFSYARHAPLLKQYLAYCGSCLTGNFFNWLTTMVLCGTFAFFAAQPLVAALIGILVGMGFNFLLCRLLVFGKQKTASVAPVNEPVENHS
ncbi:glycosyltransferase [Gimesia benthica]|uniref:Glycosyltransferase n=1 Tax=Gimesia benthica TaxID=2608982 RepID=A0A6I6AG53_9PLAN|nr:GtrA family protein [Gimesia benthica]QGQ25258.1 glycosyltransferase [Gimesia benthica]